MSLKRWIVFMVMICLTGLLAPRTSTADDAKVLPKGVTRIRLHSRISLQVDQQFNEDGDREDIGHDYSTTIGSTIFSQLALIEAGFGMPAGSASLGNSRVDVDYTYNNYDLYIEHGLTSKLSVGIKIPHKSVDADVTARMDTTTANIGPNPYYGLSGDPFGTPLIPVAMGGIQNDTLTTNLVQGFLINDYGYKPLKSWSGSGIGDVEVGARYQYLKTDNWRLAVLGGVTLPTGETDDPDNLVDLAFGSGTWGPFLYLNNDYTGIKDLNLNLTLKYALTMPDSEVIRIPDDSSQPITPNKEKVDRNRGDYFEFCASALYGFTEALGGFVDYEYTHVFEDSISGDMGYAYDQVEEASEQISHVIKVGVIYSTLPLYKKKSFPLPMQFHLLYRDRFAGKNVLASKYVEFGVGLYF